MPTTYVTYAQLIQDVHQLGRQLDGRFVGFVGIPRSGMLVASLLGIQLHAPVVGLDGILQGARLRPYHYPRLSRRLQKLLPPRGDVLVVDDSLYQGQTLCQVEQLIRRQGYSGYRYFFGAIYPSPETPEDVWPDVVGPTIPAPRYFEWNLFHHPDLAEMALDMDGVLCEDPPVFDDDGEAYQRALATAQPKHLPRVAVGTIVTCRLDRWRSLTHRWLMDHGVYYRKLVMADYPTAAERRQRCSDYGRWKGDQYRRAAATLFIESATEQAVAIARESKKPVLSLEDNKIYEEGA